MPRISITKIAADLGVSAMSVSVALRGKPGVSEALRARIMAKALQLGYRPDPVASELMALVRSRHRGRGAETLAFINTFAEPGLFKQIPGLMEFVQGAQARAKEFGYRVEMFSARGDGMTGTRLAGILKTRGVRGILVGPRWRTEPEIDFPWSDFSVVLVGEAEYGPNLYRVCNHHIHSCTTALRALVARGYKRIGLALIRDDEIKRGYDYLLGIERFRLETNEEVDLESCFYREFDAAAMTRWIGRKRLDAVVSLAVQAGEIVPALRTAKGAPVGYANLNVSGASTWSGINQHTTEVGAAAVDMLRNLLLSGERGTAPRPRIVLVEGSWVDGTTTAHTTIAQPGRPRLRR